MTYAEALRQPLTLGDPASIEARDTVAAIEELFAFADEHDVCLWCERVECQRHRIRLGREALTGEQARRQLARLQERFA